MPVQQKRQGGAGKGAGNARRISARDAALRALSDVISRGAYASQAIDRQLTDSGLSMEDRRLWKTG